MYEHVPSLHSEGQPPNLALNPGTKSILRTVLGLKLQPQTECSGVRGSAARPCLEKQYFLCNLNVTTQSTIC